MDNFMKIVMALVLLTIFAFGGFIFAFQAVASPERSRTATPAQIALITPPGFVTPTPMPLKDSRVGRGSWFGDNEWLGNNWRSGKGMIGRCSGRWEWSNNDSDTRCGIWEMRDNGWDACARGLNRKGRSRSGLLPDTDDNAVLPEDVSFEKDVLPILNARCIACHGGAAGLYLDSYQNVLNGSMYGAVILLDDPGSSKLIQYVSSGYMPLNSPPLTQAQVQPLSNWVAASAPNN